MNLHVFLYQLTCCAIISRHRIQPAFAYTSAMVRHGLPVSFCVFGESHVAPLWLDLVLLSCVSIICCSKVIKPFSDQLALTALKLKNVRINIWLHSTAEKREGGFPAFQLNQAAADLGKGFEKKPHKSPHKRRAGQTPENAAAQGRDTKERVYNAAESKPPKETPEQARQKSPCRRYEQKEPPPGSTPAKAGVEKARQGTPQRDDGRADRVHKSPSRRYEEQGERADGVLEKARHASPQRGNGTLVHKEERAKSPMKQRGGPSAFMASQDQGADEGGAKVIVKDEVTVLKRQLKDEMEASRVLQKKLREFEEVSLRERGSTSLETGPALRMENGTPSSGGKGKNGDRGATSCKGPDYVCWL